MYTFTTTAILACLPLLVSAVFTPNTPEAATIVKVGSTLNIAWAADTLGAYSNLEIQLMAGDNLAMQTLTTLATGINAATITSFSVPCPDVTPYSQIYFCQFTQGGNISTAEWTTRFTIAGADGSTTPPANSTVYSGQTINWGNAVLLSASNTTGTSDSTVASAPTTVASAITASSSDTLASSATSVSAATTTAASSSSSTTKASSVSAASASATSTKTGAGMKVNAGFGGVLVAALVAIILI